MVFEGEEIEGRHPIKRYVRYIDRIHMVLRFTSEESEELVQRYLEQSTDEDK